MTLAFQPGLVLPQADNTVVAAPISIQTHHTLTAELRQRITAFLEHCPADCNAAPEHDPRWLDVLRDGLGHEPCVLIASRAETSNGDITGYLPLAFVRSKLFGKFLVSLPYLNSGGIVARDSATAASLLRRAVELATQDRANYLELRHRMAIDHELLPRQRDEKVRMVLDLPPMNSPTTATPEEISGGLWQQLDSKVRNQIRKADRSSLKIQFGTTELLADFYAVFSQNMRDLGTPVYSQKLFAAIMKHLPGQAEFAVVRCENRVAATALLIHSPATAACAASSQVPSASCLRQFNATNANMWMYHQLLLRAMQRGSRTFDFGRSSLDSGTFRFKKQWGAKPQPTVWQYHVLRGDIDAVRPDNPSYQWKIKMWQKLPLFAANLLGPVIVRGIP